MPARMQPAAAFPLAALHDSGDIADIGRGQNRVSESGKPNRTVWYLSCMAKGKEANQSFPLRKEKNNILILEKEETLLESLCLVLSDEGYRCLPARDSASARAMIKKYKPGLILLDLQAPPESVFSFVREVHRNAPGLPVLLLSSYDDRERVAEAMRAGAAGYLFKPLDFEELLARIPSLLRR